jgi:hypothetical protein
MDYFLFGIFSGTKFLSRQLFDKTCCLSRAGGNPNKVAKNKIDWIPPARNDNME